MGGNTDGLVAVQDSGSHAGGLGSAVVALLAGMGPRQLVPHPQPCGSCSAVSEAPVTDPRPVRDRDEMTERHEFEAAHPCVRITCDDGGCNWYAVGELASGRTADVRARSLGDLLDILCMLTAMKP